MKHCCWHCRLHTVTLRSAAALAPSASSTTEVGCHRSLQLRLFPRGCAFFCCSCCCYALSQLGGHVAPPLDKRRDLAIRRCPPQPAEPSDIQQLVVMPRHHNGGIRAGPVTTGSSTLLRTLFSVRLRTYSVSLLLAENCSAAQNGLSGAGWDEVLTVCSPSPRSSAEWSCPS